MADYLSAVLAGLSITLSWPGILIVVAGTLIAMTTAFLPGIGSASLMSLLLLLTISWSQESVMLLFGALVGGATFMGSITAILFNIPGSPPNAAALIDGHPLAKLGYPKTAIACAATASGVGSVFGVLVLIALLPFLNTIIPQLGSWERLLLGVWGLSTVIALPTSSKLKSLLMCFLGLALSMVGTDPITADHRFTFGSDTLVQGIGTIPLLLGLFTLSELINWRDRSQDSSWTAAKQESDSTLAGIRAVFRNKLLTLRSSVLGTLIGIIPGIGGTAAGFIAYGQAQQHADDNSNFGSGDIRGLIAPEAAMDAKDGGSLVPAIALGLPGSEAGVFLLTALLLHGVVPGTPMLTNQLSLSMTLIFALLVSNLVTSLSGVLLTPWLAKLNRFPMHRIALPILLLSLVLIVQLNGSVWEVYVAITFGLIGYMLRALRWPLVPLIIAFILGEFLERNYALSIRLIELDRIDPLGRPAGLLILVAIAASLLFMLRSASRVDTARQFLAGDGILAAAILLLGVYMLWESMTQGLGSPTSLVAITICLGSTLMLAQCRHLIPNLRLSTLMKDIGSQVLSSNALQLMFALPLLIWLTGFYLGLSLSVVLWMWWENVTGLRTQALWLIAAILVGAVSYYFIDTVSGLSLAPGVLILGP